jgi:hypothetical protein
MEEKAFSTEAHQLRRRNEVHLARRRKKKERKKKKKKKKKKKTQTSMTTFQRLKFTA